MIKTDSAICAAVWFGLVVWLVEEESRESIVVHTSDICVSLFAMSLINLLQ